MSSINRYHKSYPGYPFQITDIINLFDQLTEFQKNESNANLEAS